MPGGSRKRLRSRLGAGGKAPSVAATQQSKTNPFEARENKRRKHAVVNQHLRGQSRNVAAARSRAVETRKATLLVEYQNTGKNNKFVDRRFGEGVPEISNEEKMLRRFQRQRERELKRASKFALGDDDEQGDEDLALTHGGRQITEDFDFGSATRGPQPEVEAGELDAALVEAANFGGGDGEGDEASRRHRTHKEIMEEVIAKSKYYKALRQAEAQKTEEDIERLDEGMDEITRLLQFKEQKPKGVEAELRAALQRAQDRNKAEGRDGGQDTGQGRGQGGAGAEGGALGTEAHSKYGDFGSVMRDLAKEQRARASERSMRPEEIAAEAKKRLEELEKKRQDRMEGKDTGSGEEEEEEEEEDESEDESGDEDEDESEDEESESEEEEEESEEESGKRRGKRAPKDGKAAKAARAAKAEEEMPYVIECPTSFEALSDLVAQWGSRLRTLLDRVLTCTSVHLAAENRGKLEKLLELLVRYLAAMGALQPYDVEMGDAVATACFRIAHELPGPAVACFRRALERMSQRRSRAVAKAARLAAERGSALDERALRCSVWPTAGELLQLQLAARVFPTSDKRHPVATVVQLFLGKCLTQTPLRCVRDVASAVMCAVVLLRCVEPAQRFAPEVVGFTQSLLCHLFPSRAAVAAARLRRSAPGSGAEAVAPSSLSPEEAVREGCLLPCIGTHPLAWLSLEGSKRRKARDVPEDAPLDVFSLPFSWCQARPRAEDGAEDGEPPSRKEALAREEAAEGKVQKQGLTRLRVLRAAYQLIERSSQQLGGPEACPALPEALAPLVEALPRTLPPSLPASLRERHVECAAALQQARKSVREAREPLRWQVAEVLPLKSMTPKFDINYAPGKDMDPDKQRSEQKKLQRAVAREKRGAMRSLRRDASFLATAKQKEDEEARADQKEEQKRVQQFLEGQQHEFKQLQREGKAKGGGMKKHLF